MKYSTLKSPSDIPSSWPILKARKKTTVSIRESIGREQFEVSWQDSILESDPELDLIIIQPNGSEYPCKKEIFYGTYTEITDTTPGKSVAWIDYMTNFNRTFGNFAPGMSESFMAKYRDWETDRKSTRLNSSHITRSRMPSSA